MPVNGIFQNGVFSCGFGFVNTGGSVLQVFDTSTGGAVVWVTSHTRFGSGVSLELAGATATKNLNVNLPTLIEGFAFESQTLVASGWTIIKEWCDAGTVQVSLQVNNLGQLQFFQGAGTTTPLGLATAQGTIGAAAFNFFQVQITFSASGGQVTLLLNSSTIPLTQATGLNTAPSGNNWVNQSRFVITGAGVAGFFQDWYMLDMTGAAPFNTFLGNGRTFLSAPASDSATAGLNTWSVTTPQGSDFANFAQIPPNSADYNFSQTVGARASCKFPALPSTSRVFFFNTWESDELDAAGARTIAVITRNNSIDQQGPAITPVNGTFVYHNTISTIDPNTGQPWANGLVANTSNMDIGPVVVS